MSLAGLKMSASVLALVGMGILCVVPTQRTAYASSVSSQTDGTAQTKLAYGDSAAQRALINRYCVTCHNQRLKTAGLALDTLDLGNAGENPKVWEAVVRKLRAGAMPPSGSRQPEVAERASLGTWLATTLDRAAASKPNPGRATLHRLNRTEYSNAIRDLLALEVDVRALLPADTQGRGFDNNADALSLTPGVLERYISAAQKVSRLALGSPVSRYVDTERLSPLLEQDAWMDEDLPFGTRGGTAFRHYFPVDGEYVIRVFPWVNGGGSGTVRGLYGQWQEVDVRLDGVSLGRIKVGGPRPARGEAPSTAHDFKDGLEVRFSAKAGLRVVAVSFSDRHAALEGPGPTHVPVNNESHRTDAGLAVDHIDIDGPYSSSGPGDTPARQRVLICRPQGTKGADACATKILTRLVRLAYRRPVTKGDVDPLMNLYRQASRTGFEDGIERAIEGILVSPDFLFRVEVDPPGVNPGGIYRVSAFELASRLSFFLWSSVPDQELLEVAAQGHLQDPAVLESQVRRMLGDERASALMTNFGGQWLQLRNIRLSQPDHREFPEFDDNLRSAFETETQLFLESQRREDKNVLELLTARYTFLNERLARHYEIPGVYGSHFRKVDLIGDTRVGILGHGSLLTVTSQANRTSPVARGKWLLENILGTPPPAPPPGVPALGEAGDVGVPVSVRARMEQHRKNPACASCHKMMDPLGFALENFDAVGKWRTTERDQPIDTSGTLPDGTAFHGVVELEKALLRDPEQFVTTVTEKLLTYALGRGVEYYDAPAVRRIVHDAGAQDYHWSALIMGVVNSVPFQMRVYEP